MFESKTKKENPFNQQMQWIEQEKARVDSELEQLSADFLAEGQEPLDLSLLPEDMAKSFLEFERLASKDGLTRLNKRGFLFRQGAKIMERM